MDGEVAPASSAAQAGVRASVPPVPDEVIRAVAGEQHLPGPRDFAAALREVDVAARDWGIQWDAKEGRFVQALMGAIGWVGRVAEGSQAEFRSLLKEGQATVDAELEVVRELVRAGQAQVVQSRNAMLALAAEKANLQTDREKLVVRMIGEVMPLFIAEMRRVLVVREEGVNAELWRRRTSRVAVAVLGIFASGYALCYCTAGGPADRALQSCLEHPQIGDGRVYCDVTWFAGDVGKPAKK